MARGVLLVADNVHCLIAPHPDAAACRDNSLAARAGSAAIGRRPLVAARRCHLPPTAAPRHEHRLAGGQRPGDELAVEKRLPVHHLLYGQACVIGVGGGDVIWDGGNDCLERCQLVRRRFIGTVLAMLGLYSVFSSSLGLLLCYSSLSCSTPFSCRALLHVPCILEGRMRFFMTACSGQRAL